MISIAFAQLKATWRRAFAVIIAVIIGVAFFTAAMLSGNLANAQIERQIATQAVGADIVIMGGDSEGLRNAATLSVDGATGSDIVQTVYGTANDSGFVALGPLPRLDALRSNIQLEEGRLPETSNEILLESSSMSRLQLELGDSLTWTPFEETTSTPLTFTVVGTFFGGTPTSINDRMAMITQEAWAPLDADSNVIGVLVTTASPAVTQQVAQRYTDQLGDSTYRVQTFDEFVQQQLSEWTGQSLAIQFIGGVFALIALFAAALVISNTFQISVTQRTRELAILRAIGSTRGQVRKGVLLEALALGITASVLGILVGIGVIAAVNMILWSADQRADTLGVTALTIIVPLLLGTFVTLIGAWLPSREATRVHPLQALRQADAPVDLKRVSRRRWIISVGLEVIGILVMVGGTMLSHSSSSSQQAQGGILIAVFGGMISFIGLLLLARLIIPPTLGALSGLARMLSGMTGELAGSNLQRNRGRTSSTSAALLFGVTLVAMCVVGAATVKASVVGTVNDHLPIDVTLQSADPDNPIVVDDALIARMASQDGVSGVAAVIDDSSLTGTFQGLSQSMSTWAIDPAQIAPFSRGDQFTDLPDDTILVDGSYASMFGVTSGDQLTISGPSGEVTMTVRLGDVPNSSTAMTVTALARIDSSATPQSIWIGLDDNVNIDETSSALQDMLPAGTNSILAGGAIERAMFISILDRLLQVAMALLAAALVIAVVGIGNTLTLSVIERTRESGMLRAMGMTVSEMRRTLAIEGVLISLAGAIIGIIAGTMYGWAGATAILGSEMPIRLGLPLWQLGAVILAALICGVVASILPARRAASISPIEALATIS